MSLFDEIQFDILSTASLTIAMRKAKVLAYRLKNQEFKTWVEHELNGYYETDTPLPKYRRVSTHSLGNFNNLAWQYKNSVIDLRILPDDLQEKISVAQMHQGIKELESLVTSSSSEKGQHQVGIPWKAELLGLYNSKMKDNAGGYVLTEARSVISSAALEQILDDIRNRLLGFILELAERYPEQTKSDFENVTPIPNEQVSQVFHVKIMGSGNIITPSALVSQGGNMSFFDQRNQNVNYQFNAAGNINFDLVKSRDDLVNELEKLKMELSQAAEVKVIPDETAIDAKYQIDKAIQQTKKPQPSKKTIIQHISEAKELLSTIASAAGIVTALTQAADWVQKFFK